MLSFLFFALSFSLPRRKNLKSKLSYAECFSFVRHLEDDIHNDVPVDQLKKKGQQYCDNIPDKVRQDFCTSLIQDEQFEKIYNLSKNQNMSPESICTKMGYSRGFGRGKVISEEQCTSIIDSLKEELKKNNNPSHENSDETGKLNSKRNKKHRLNKLHPNSIKFSHSNVCRKFTDNDKMACQMVSRIAYRALLDDIQEGEESIRICHKLQDLRKIQLAKDET